MVKIGTSTSRSIQRTMFNYNRWCKQIDEVDFKSYCKKVGAILDLKPNPSTNHICAPMATSAPFMDSIGGVNSRTMVCPRSKTVKIALKTEVENKFARYGVKAQHYLTKSYVNTCYEIMEAQMVPMIKEETALHWRDRLEDSAIFVLVDESSKDFAVV